MEMNEKSNNNHLTGGSYFVLVVQAQGIEQRIPPCQSSCWHNWHLLPSLSDPSATNYSAKKKVENTTPYTGKYQGITTKNNRKRGLISNLVICMYSVGAS